MRYAKGIMWLDNCRIPFVETDPLQSGDRSDRNVMMGWKTDSYVNGVGNNTLPPEQAQGSPLGRFTPNLLVCDDMLNDGIIYKSGDGSGNMELININDAHHFSYENPNRKITKMKGVQYNDKGTNSRYYDLDKWFDKIIDNL